MRIRFADGEFQNATLERKDDSVVVSSQRATFRVSRQQESNGQEFLYPRLLECAQEASPSKLLCCGSCLQFRFSGMSFDMSAGTRGFCGRVGFRNRRGYVDVDHLCGEYEPAPAWVDDPKVCDAARIEASSRCARQDAIAGSLVGLAIGDALGFPAEFRTRNQILDAFGPTGLTDFVAVHDERWPQPPYIMGTHHPPATYSDDTQMTIAVAQGLLDADSSDVDIVMNAIAGHFVTWSRADNNDRAPGETCMTGCRSLEQGVPWREAGVANSKGCGSAMRVAPIGLRHWRDHKTLIELAKASSLLTHGHPAAIVSAGAAALLVALALEKKTPEAMHKCLTTTFAGQSADFDRRLAQLPHMLEQPPQIALSKQGLGEAWVAEEAVVCALYCFWRSPLDFEETVLIATNTDGDSDSIACIAGSISGAFNGIGAIPQRWRTRVEGAEQLLALAAGLAGESS